MTAGGRIKRNIKRGRKGKPSVKTVLLEDGTTAVVRVGGSRGFKKIPSPAATKIVVQEVSGKTYAIKNSAINRSAIRKIVHEGTLSKFSSFSVPRMHVADGVASVIDVWGTPRRYNKFMSDDRVTLADWAVVGADLSETMKSFDGGKILALHTKPGFIEIVDNGHGELISRLRPRIDEGFSDDTALDEDDSQIVHIK